MNRREIGERLMECESRTEFVDMFPKLTESLDQNEVLDIIWLWGQDNWLDGHNKGKSGEYSE